MYNPYSNNYTSYASSCQMLNPLEPGLVYPNSPPPPPMHSVFTNYDYGYCNQLASMSNRHMPSGQSDSTGGSNKRKLEDQMPSSSPLSSTSCSSSASFSEENDSREPSVKRSRKVTPKTVRRQSSANNTVSEDSESDEAESRQRSLERNRLAASKCRQRKKEWIDELAHKAEKMTRENEYLKQMLMQLKEETLYLKSQLIMHKNNDMNPCQNKPFINLF